MVNLLEDASVLGQPFEILHHEDLNIIGVRYKSTFVTQSNDNEFMFKLLCLGFELISTKKLVSKMVLPIRWLHLKTIKGEEIIIDEFGRIRIIINTKEKIATLKRRYGYEIEALISTAPKIESDPQYARITYLDQDVEIENIMIERPELEELQSVSQIYGEEFYKFLEETANQYLSSYYPDWRNELAYWDVNLEGDGEAK